MSLFRRRAPNPEHTRALAAFRVAVTHVDAAQRALLAAIPTARDPGIPLHRALADMRMHLDAADAAMPAWRNDRTAHEWTNCTQAIAQARERAGRLERHPGLDFEALTEQVGRVIGPLDQFVEAARALRRS